MITGFNDFGTCTGCYQLVPGWTGSYSDARDHCEDMSTTGYLAGVSMLKMVESKWWIVTGISIVFFRRMAADAIPGEKFYKSNILYQRSFIMYIIDLFYTGDQFLFENYGVYVGKRVYFMN